jgi:ComEC/Rec2-related protein
VRVALPALPCLAYWLAGALPVLLPAFGAATWPVALAWGGAGALLGRWCVGGWRWPAAAWAGAGLALSLLHLWAPWQSYRRALPVPQAYVEAEAVVVSTYLPEEPELAWLGDTAAVEVALRRLRLGPAAPWVAGRGRVLVRRLEGLPLRYGQTLRLSGALVEPAAGRLPGNLDYARILRVRGIRHLLLAESCVIVRPEPSGWRRWVAAGILVRERVLQRLIREVPQRERQQVLAAMAFGFYQGLDPAERERYLRSGMIHLFSVSGLHVALLFCLLMVVGVLLRVPFGLRHFLAPALLLVYVVGTGAAPAAIRAWLMLTVWAVGRGLRLPTIAANSVLAAALLLLLGNPLLGFQSGFQFSFVIVLALVLGWHQAAALLHYLHERRLWVPARQERRWWWWGDWLWHKVVRGVLGMSAAWLAGVGLTAHYNQLFLPASLIANLCTGLLGNLLMWLGAIKLFLGCFVPLAWERWLGILLGWGLGLLETVAELAARHGQALAVPQPPLALTLLFHAGLLALLLSGTRLRRAALAAAALAGCVVLLAAPWRVAPRTRLTALLPPGSPVPVILVQPPGRARQPVLLNAGDRGFAYSLTAWLRAQGIGSLEELWLLDNSADYRGGATTLLERFPIGRLYLLANARRDLAPLQDAARANGAHWALGYRLDQLTAAGLVLTREPTREAFRGSLTVTDADGRQATLRWTSEPYRGCRLALDEEQAAQPQQEWQLDYARAERVLRLR